MRRTILTAIAVWALAISPLAACSKGNDNPRTNTTTATTTTGTPSAPAAKTYTKADLDAALLTLADLPANYAPNPGAGPEYPVMSSCSDEALAMDSYFKDAKIKTGVSFSTTSGQFVVQSITLLSGDAANNTFAALKQALARCTMWTVQTARYTLSPIAYGPYADETISYRVNVQNDVPFVHDTVFVRKGNLVVGVMVADLAPPPKDAQAIVDTVVRKLAAL